MILCSQAKLENDQKGINVKRGIRAKCNMGWRPGMPPIGYYNRAFAGVKDIVVDPDRGSIITKMFRKVAEDGDSGRTIKRWFDETGMTTRAKKKVTLSQIYQMLKNPFYYGEFEYPLKSGNWYRGKHPSLITKETFDKVQKQLVTCPKSPWEGKIKLLTVSSTSSNFNRFEGVNVEGTVTWLSVLAVLFWIRPIASLSRALVNRLIIVYNTSITVCFNQNIP